MKNFLFVAILFISSTLLAQNTPICGSTSSAHWLVMTADADFTTVHANPLPWTKSQPSLGKMISLPCEDGKHANAYFIPSVTKSNKWVFVFQEWWGLNEYIQSESEKIFKALKNVNVMALDMYDGQVTDDRNKAGQLMGAFKQERGNQIVKAALAYAGNQAKIATIGWCFGGGQSMQAALAAGKQASGCIIYYGMPEENIDRLMNLHGDVLMVWPNQDKWITKEVMDKFKKNMEMAGKKLSIREYEADHAFANPSNPKHNAAFAKKAFDESIQFLRERLK